MEPTGSSHGHDHALDRDRDRNHDHEEMVGESAFLELFELFLKLDATVIFVVSKKRSQRLLEVVSSGRFRKNHT